HVLLHSQNSKNTIELKYYLYYTSGWNEVLYVQLVQYMIH
uniref:Uncharacterized protein n=1 Tax=Amphimedon queenslandica TaxID=400682 RepID=A0A1X7VE58_AMPQE